MAGIVRELTTLWNFDIDGKPLKELDAGINTIKSSIVGIGIAVGAAAAGIGFLLNRAGGEEQTLVAFETMLGSVERAKELLTDIKQFADVTPFNTEEVVQASKGLLAFGVAQEDIIEKTRNLGNIASGVGKDKFNTLVRGFGKIKTKGKATMEELNMFLEAGVPILDELAKNMGVTQKEIFKLVSTGKVGFAEVDNAIKTLSTGTGKFANLMAKQSKTLFGLLSTVQGQLDNFAKDIGKELLPVAKEAVTLFLDWFSANKDIIKSKMIVFVKNLVGFIRDLIGMMATFFRALTGIVGLFGGWNKALNATFKIFSAIMGLGILVGIGLLAKGLFGLGVAWHAMGMKALFAQAKMMLIPLAIGAIVTAIALIAEDIMAFSQGRDSVFGRMLGGLSMIFEKMAEKFKGFGSLGKILIKALLTPVRIIVNGFQAILTVIDVLRGKMGFLKGLKSIGSGILNTLGIGGADSLRGAIGLADNVGKAIDQVDQASSPAKAINQNTVSNQSKNQTTKNVSVEQKVDVNLNMTGLDAIEAKKLVDITMEENVGNMLRNTIRDGASQVER